MAFIFLYWNADENVFITSSICVLFFPALVVSYIQLEIEIY